MFTLVLYYPNESRARGASETIRSSNIPQIGQTINGDNYYGIWVVAEVHQSIQDGVLSDTVGITLKEED